jgi:4'-phosphopantetheinyl transferase
VYLNCEQEWREPPCILRIEDQQIHVWRGKLRPNVLKNFNLAHHLSDEEISRAGKFLRNDDQEIYLFAHCMLRSIIGFYLNCLPRYILFKNGKYNKPSLAFPTGNQDLHFNLSHSKNAVLVAVARNEEVGVDIEYVRNMDNIHQIINSNFSAEECKYLLSLPENQIQKAFYIHWTLKEAFVKGNGMGLYYPLQNFNLSQGKYNNEIGCLYDALPKKGPGWKCLQINPFPGYVGALAAENICKNPIFWNYQRIDFISK